MLIDDIKMGQEVFFNGGSGSVKFRVVGFPIIALDGKIQEPRVALLIVGAGAYYMSKYRFTMIVLKPDVLDVDARKPPVVSEQANELRFNVGNPPFQDGNF